jgi:hypothetical protein
MGSEGAGKYLLRLRKVLDVTSAPVSATLRTRL